MIHLSSLKSLAKDTEIGNQCLENGKICNDCKMKYEMILKMHQDRPFGRDSKSLGLLFESLCGLLHPKSVPLQINTDSKKEKKAVYKKHIQVLESEFMKEMYPSHIERLRISMEIGKSMNYVKNWYTRKRQLVKKRLSKQSKSESPSSVESSLESALRSISSLAGKIEPKEMQEEKCSWEIIDTVSTPDTIVLDNITDYEMNFERFFHNVFDTPSEW